MTWWFWDRAGHQTNNAVSRARNRYILVSIYILACMPRIFTIWKPFTTRIRNFDGFFRILFLRYNIGRVCFSAAYYSYQPSGNNEINFTIDFLYGSTFHSIRWWVQLYAHTRIILIEFRLKSATTKRHNMYSYTEWKSHTFSSNLQIEEIICLRAWTHFLTFKL